MNKKTLNYMIFTLLIIIVMFLIVKTASCSEFFGSKMADNASVVMYYADYCPACRVAKPIFEQVKTKLEREHKVKFIMHDIAKHPVDFIDKIPTIFLTSRDHKKLKYLGLISVEDLTKWILLNY